jgi:4-amino-4-deoxy-L-arabinose transferase-like glycosyltransferase
MDRRGRRVVGSTQAGSTAGVSTPGAERRAPSAEGHLPIAITLIAGLVRLILAAFTPLFPDETYYWDWSRHLAAGYFDHPPMIAWLIRCGTLLAGDTALGVRVFPVVAGVVAGLFMCAGARRLGGGRAALITAVIFAVMPLSAAGLILATPDAPLFAAAAALVYALLRAHEHAPRSSGSLRWWSVAGVALGVAMSSKYTAGLLPLGVFAALLLRRALRPRLAEPGPYVATVISLLVFSPVVIWNARHDWASFAFQLQHGLGGAAGSVWKRELDLIGGQMGLVTPILFVMIVVAVIRSSSSLLSPLSALVFLFFMYSATRRRVEANWPALAYVPAILLAAAHAGARSWDRWLRGGVVLAALVTIVAYINSFTPILPVPARRDPVARSAGWDELGRAVNTLHAPRLRMSSRRTWVSADRYQEASELAFHLPSHPETFALNLTTRRNQYDLWPTFIQRASPRDALILVTDDVAGQPPTIALLTPHFGQVTRGEQVVLARAGDPVKYLRIWLLEGWRGTWPPR